MLGKSGWQLCQCCFGGGADCGEDGVLSARRDRDGVVSARRQMANGVRNDIRSATGLEGGAADGNKNGMASARAFRCGFGAGVAMVGRRKGGKRRFRQGRRKPKSRPGIFSKKSPKKYFWKHVSYCYKTTCGKKTFCYTVTRS